MQMVHSPRCGGEALVLTLRRGCRDCPGWAGSDREPAADEPGWQAEALAQVAGALAGAGDHRQAVALASWRERLWPIHARLG
jgi:hypothetical protein